MDSGLSHVQPLSSAPSRLSRLHRFSHSSSTLFSKSSLRWLLGNSSIWNRSTDRPSRRISLDPSLDADSPRAPLYILQLLLDILLENKIPGPTLVRLESEFNVLLGKGSTFEVLGVADKYVSLVERVEDVEIGARSHDTVSESHLHTSRFHHHQQHSTTVNESFRKSLEQWKHVAVKRAYISDTARETFSGLLSEQITTRSFGHQIVYALTEIQALCHAPFRSHPNIVQLMGWGLCLDTLEDTTRTTPLVPLLFLERASGSLTEFIEERASDHLLDRDIFYVQARNICLGTGYGMQAIHEAGLSHGDLKPDNVLLFPNPSLSADSPKYWTAKLCDFGLLAPEDVIDNDAEAYKGTPGWVPLEESPRRKVGSMQACDIFSFGLIIWCLFTGRSKSPVTSREGTDDGLCYNEDALFTTASRLLKASRFVPASELNRIRNALRGCLHTDRRLWDRSPWKYFDTTKFPTVPSVEIAATPLMDANLLLTRLVELFAARNVHSETALPTESQWPDDVTYSIWTSKPKVLLRYAKRTYRQYLHPMYDSTVTSCWRYIRRPALSRRQSTLERVCRLCSDLLLVKMSPNVTFPIKHEPHEPCYDLRFMFKEMQRVVGNLWLVGTNSNLVDELYALVRLRSRFRFCCWRFSVASVRNIEREGFPNILSDVIALQCDFMILAWCSRGPIGAQELQSLDYKSAYSWLLQEVKWWEQKKHEFRTDLLLLFLERGHRLNRKLLHKGHLKTPFRIYLESLFSADSKSLINHVCKRMMKVSQTFDEFDDFRYFCTGSGLPDQLGEMDEADVQDYSTTALHESVITSSYQAVETLIALGASVNALDSNSMTPLQLAHQLMVAPGTESATPTKSSAKMAALEVERIYHLLKQNKQSMWAEADLNLSEQSDHLPPGWQKIQVTHKDAEDSVGQHTTPAYKEKHFGSITFKRPKFSFFSDQRLALGLRKIVAPGQTYYADLIRFIDRSRLQKESYTLNSESSRIILDKWFHEDITRTANTGNDNDDAQESVSSPMRLRSAQDSLRPWYGNWNANLDGEGDERGTFRLHGTRQNNLWAALNQQYMRQKRQVIRFSQDVKADSFALLTGTAFNLLLPAVPFCLGGSLLGFSSEVIVALSVCSLVALSAIGRDSFNQISLFLVEEPQMICLGSLMICVMEITFALQTSQIAAAPLAEYLMVGSINTTNLLILGCCYVLHCMTHVVGYLHERSSEFTNPFAAAAVSLFTITSLVDLPDRHRIDNPYPITADTTGTRLVSVLLLVTFFFCLGFASLPLLKSFKVLLTTRWLASIIWAYETYIVDPICVLIFFVLGVSTLSMTVILERFLYPSDFNDFLDRVVRRPLERQFAKYEAKVKWRRELRDYRYHEVTTDENPEDTNHSPFSNPWTALTFGIAATTLTIFCTINLVDHLLSLSTKIQRHLTLLALPLIRHVPHLYTDLRAASEGRVDESTFRQTTESTIILMLVVPLVNVANWVRHIKPISFNLLELGSLWCGVVLIPALTLQGQCKWWSGIIFLLAYAAIMTVLCIYLH